MSSDTGPAASEIKKLREAIDGVRTEGMQANSGGSNGGKSWLNVNSVLQALIIAGIVGLFTSISSLKESAVRVETTINERGKQNDSDFQRIYTALDRHDKRLTDLERSQGPGEPNAHDRQKR